MKKLILMFVVVLLAFGIVGCNKGEHMTADELLEIVLDIADVTGVTTGNLNLVTQDSDQITELNVRGLTSIVWTSSNTTAVANDGTVTTQFVDQSVALTVVVTIGDDTASRMLTTIVQGLGGEAQFDAVWAHIASTMPARIVIAEPMTLLATFPTGVTGAPDAAGQAITWTSSNTTVITNAGVVTLPESAVTVTMTASITIDGFTRTRGYEISVGFDSSAAWYGYMATNPGKVIEYGTATSNADLRTILAAAFDRGSQQVEIKDLISGELFGFTRANSLLVDRVTPTSNNVNPSNPDWPSGFNGGIGFLLGPAIRDGGVANAIWSTPSLTTNFMIYNLSEVNFALTAWASDMFFQIFHSNQEANPRFLGAVNVLVSEDGEEWTLVKDLLPDLIAQSAGNTAAFTTYTLSVTLDEPGDYFVRIEFPPVANWATITSTFNLRMIMTDLSFVGDRPTSPAEALRNAASSFLTAFDAATDAAGRVTALDDNLAGLGVPPGEFRALPTADQQALVDLLQTLLEDDYADEVAAMIAKTADGATIRVMTTLINDMVTVYTSHSALLATVTAMFVADSTTDLISTVMQTNVDDARATYTSAIAFVPTSSVLGDEFLTEIVGIYADVLALLNAADAYLAALSPDEMKLRAAAILASEMLSGTAESVVQSLLDFYEYFGFTDPIAGNTVANVTWLLTVNGLVGDATLNQTLDDLLTLVEGTEATAPTTTDVDTLTAFISSSLTSQVTLLALETRFAESVGATGNILPSVTQAVLDGLTTDLAAFTEPGAGAALYASVAANMTTRVAALQTTLDTITPQFASMAAGLAINMVTSEAGLAGGSYLDQTFMIPEMVSSSGTNITRMPIDAIHANFQGRAFVAAPEGGVAGGGPGICTSLRAATPVADAANLPSGFTAGLRHTVVALGFPVRQATEVTFTFYIWGGTGGGDAQNITARLGAVLVQTSTDGTTWTTVEDVIEDVLAVGDTHQTITVELASAADVFIRIVWQGVENWDTANTTQFRTVVIGIQVQGFVLPAS